VIRYVIHRLLQSAILLVLVSMIGFSLLHFAPGGPTAIYAVSTEMTAEDLRRIEERFGLDQPLPVQYVRWVSGLAIGDWGNSYRNNAPVLNVVFSRVPATLQLMVGAVGMAVVFGTLIGILGALRRYSFFDYLATIGAMIALSIPTFWFGLMAIYLFSVNLGWLPSGGRATYGDESFVNYLRHMILPTLVLALVTIAIWSRYSRSSMIDVVNQDYINVARAKGLSEWYVISRHALRNAVLPLITVAGIQLPILFGGALVTETVFSWPGMGRLFVDSLGYRDYPVLMGILMFTAVIVVLTNLVVDLLYAVFDPRIRLN
jgi:peptide/nickel transport system permease protein